MRTTPSTFVAGDWKLGNLGSRPDGRTIVLDWAYPGQAPPCWELAWYLALNRSRLPEAKEATIERYRRGLERRGVETGDWWDRQLGLCLVGIMATFAWEKAVGDEDELVWWTSAALAGARWLE
jgi:aminoglycoside phosphotransferase (APT) family kinase protein